MAEKNRPTVSVTLDRKLVRTVKELAKKNERSLSMQLEKLVEQALILGLNL